MNKIPDEPAVVTNKSMKCSYLFSILGGFISLIAADLEGSSAEDMAQILNFPGEEVTLPQFHSYFCIAKFVENLL